MNRLELAKYVQHIIDKSKNQKENLGQIFAPQEVKQVFEEDQECKFDEI